MSDELLPYYNRELAFIRDMGAEFAEAHPKIAGRLRLGPDSAKDPHVARMIEAFAYLNARIRHKSARSSSLANSPAISCPNATITAPVRVARSTMARGL